MDAARNGQHNRHVAGEAANDAGRQVLRGVNNAAPAQPLDLAVCRQHDGNAADDVPIAGRWYGNGVELHVSRGARNDLVRPEHVRFDALAI